MGYELKLKIGHLMVARPEYKRQEKYVLDGDYAYRPMLKDDNGKFIPSGRTESTFLQVAMLNLCKIYDSNTYALAMKSKVKTKEPKHVIKWFVDANNETDTDNYGDRFKTISLNLVIAALEKDVKQFPEYRRFHWALGLCKAIQENDPEDLMVLFEGY